MRFLLIPLLAVYARGDSVTVEITANRQAIVHEHFTESASGGLIFLASPCARIDNIQDAGGRIFLPTGNGPWRVVSIPPAPLDFSYQAVPVAAFPRNCAVPMLMPRHPISSVSITVTDHGSGLQNISVPHLVEEFPSRTWTAQFPAVPSQLRLEWDSGNIPPGGSRDPEGLFEWNFRSLVGILITWIAAYLFWARRQAA